MSKRKELALKRQQRTRQRTLIVIGAVAAAALVVISFSVYQATRPLGEIVGVEKVDYPFADGKALGATSAPVLIQVFSDFQCPYCGLLAREGEARLIADYVAAGKVRLEYKHYIVVDGNVGGSESRRAAEASECAAEQGQFWNYHAIVFANQNGEGLGAFSDRRLKAFAETIGLDMAAFNSCFDSRQYSQEVRADERLARSLGVNSTPTIFVAGNRINNPLDYDEIKRAIERALTAR